MTLSRFLRRIVFWLAAAVLALWSLGPVYWIVVSSISTRIELYSVPYKHWIPHIALFQLMSVLGLIDTKLGLILLFVAYGAPLYVWLMQTYIRATPRDIEEAALIDGASRFRALRTVVLPVALPGLVSVFLVAFLTVWNAFLIPLIFTNSENAQSLTVVLSLFIGQDVVAWEAKSAEAVVTMIPPVVMALFFQRYVVRGLALGAVQ